MVRVRGRVGAKAHHVRPAVGWVWVWVGEGVGVGAASGAGLCWQAQARASVLCTPVLAPPPPPPAAHPPTRHTAPVRPRQPQRVVDLGAGKGQGGGAVRGLALGHQGGHEGGVGGVAAWSGWVGRWRAVRVGWGGLAVQDAKGRTPACRSLAAQPRSAAAAPRNGHAPQVAPAAQRRHGQAPGAELDALAACARVRGRVVCVSAAGGGSSAHHTRAGPASPLATRPQIEPPTLCPRGHEGVHLPLRVHALAGPRPRRQQQQVGGDVDGVPADKVVALVLRSRVGGGGGRAEGVG